MVIGTLVAIVHGSALPLMIILFGGMTDMFIDNEKYVGYVEEIMPNLTQIYPNMTTEWALANPDDFM